MTSLFDEGFSRLISGIALIIFCIFFIFWTTPNSWYHQIVFGSLFSSLEFVEQLADFRGAVCYNHSAHSK